MTSPISSNWFYYTTMASLVQASSAANQTGNSANPLNGSSNNTSMFMSLLSSMMQGGEMDPSMLAALNPTANSDNGQMMAQLNNTYKPISVSLPASSTPVAAETVAQPAVPNLKTDLNFKPIQFLKLENTLGGKLSGTSAHFINAGKKYDLDPNLLSAIAIHETGNGTSRAANEKNNIAGMMGKNGLRSYDSVEESIFDMARNLRQNYLNQGKTTIAAIGAKYAPVGAGNDPTGLNNHWVTGVNRQLNKLT
ncbi:glucosaminidase domain-containing protein [Planomicrobium okeanokoites]|uniref:Glucosaminidase domain-containing protein n=1 Tax=Planomicrobium okeanokoites TaxID=244 RepID=A0ABV7KIS9_PLAOK|nr:glucosaminidase domain-containing protein [Planomicrobium okeanokoites]TAA69066.1 conjugal transfer protein [Planomicrobium okeanokoites]